jgi:DNA-binding IclR family transcriptional regulator
MKQMSVSAVKSADRAFDILEFVADAAEPPSFSQLLSGLGIPRSSLFHLLSNLLARNYLVQDGASYRYRLGGRIRQLADRIQGPTLAVIVTPFLRQLSAELNETSGFYVRVGDDVEVVAAVASSQALAYTMKVGERAPLYAVSAGKMMLAYLSPDDTKSYFARLRLEAITPRTITSAARLREEIVTIRRDGVAYSREEFTPGITGIAVAVAYEAQFFGAINLSVPTARFSSEQDVAFRRQLRSAASLLAQTLHAQGAA